MATRRPPQGRGNGSLNRLHMKAWQISVLIAMAAHIGCAAAEKSASRRIPMDGYAAAVNDRVITVRETLSAMQPVERQLQQSFQGEELSVRVEEAFTNTLESLIERELILDAFRRMQGTIPDNVVKSRMDQIERTRFNGSRADLLKALEAEDLTMDEWRESLRNTMIVSYMREHEVEDKVLVSPRAVRDAYEADLENYRLPAQVELRMISLNRGQTDEEQAVKLKQAGEIRQRLMDGQDFATLATQVSEGIKSGDGGYWGWIDPTTRRPELAEAIQALEPGGISPVVAAGEMLYIVKVEGRRAAAQLPFEEVQDKIRDELRRRQSKQLYETWIQRLKRDAYIRRF